MISAAVLELCGSDVDDTLSGSVRNQMHEAKQILAGIAESHAAADARFIVGSRTALTIRNERGEKEYA